MLEHHKLVNLIKLHIALKEVKEDLIEIKSYIKLDLKENNWNIFNLNSM